MERRAVGALKGSWDRAALIPVALIFISRHRSIWRLCARVRWLNLRFFQDALSALNILSRFKSRI
jgi:hypothetical protein